MGNIPDDRHDGAASAPRNPIEPWIEASALVLLSVLPLMFTPMANFFFEGTKSFLFRAFGLIGAGLLALWAAVAIVQHRAGADALPREPHWPWRGFGLPLLAALLAIGTQGVATLFALHRNYALHGAPDRGGGWLNLLAAGILLLSALVVARRPDGLRRLLEALALGTLAPVAIGLLQRCGLDPLGMGGGNPAERVSGSFGNPMFLGSYLALASPLTIWLAWIHARLAARRQAILYGLLALLQLATLWFTGSRGPLGAWAGVAALAAPLALLASGRRRLARRLAALMLLGVCSALLLFHLLFVQSFNASGPPTARERALRVRSVLVRLHIYRTVARTMTDNRPLARADRPDLTDRHARLRPWIGFGPQSLALITGRHFPPDLERLERGNRIIDSAHNQLLDTWAASGLAGVCSQVLLLIAVLALLLRPLGLCATPSQRRRALCVVLGATVLLMLALVWGWGPWAWPLGFAAGLYAGLLGAVLAAPAGGAAHADASRPGAAILPLHGLPIALTAAFFAQLLDAQSNVLTVATTMGFWLLIGLIMRLESARAEAVRPRPNGARVAPERGIFLLLALVTAVTLHASLAMDDSLSSSLVRVLADGWRSGAIPLGAVVCLAGMARAGRTARGWVILGGGWMLGAIAWSVWLARLFGVKLKTVEEVFSFAERLAFMSGACYVWLACGMLAAGCLLATARPRRLVLLCAGVVILGGMSVMLSWPRSGRRAAALDATARFLESAKRDDLSAACLQRALGRSPWDERFHLRRYALFGRIARRTSDISARDGTMIQALTALQGALRTSPYDTGHPERLGMLYYNWAVQSPNDGSRQLLGKEAVTWLERAANLTPGRSSVGLKAMDAVMVLADDTPHAERLLRAILARDPANARAAELLAYLSWHLSRLDTTPAAQRNDRRGEAILLARRALASPWRAYYKKMDIQRLTRIAGAGRNRPPASDRQPPGRRADRE